MDTVKGLYNGDNALRSRLRQATFPPSNRRRTAHRTPHHSHMRHWLIIGGAVRTIWGAPSVAWETAWAAWAATWVLFVQARRVAPLVCMLSSTTWLSVVLVCALAHTYPCVLDTDFFAFVVGSMQCILQASSVSLGELAARRGLSQTNVDVGTVRRRRACVPSVASADRKACGLCPGMCKHTRISAAERRHRYRVFRRACRSAKVARLPKYQRSPSFTITVEGTKSAGGRTTLREMADS